VQAGGGLHRLPLRGVCQVGVVRCCGPIHLYPSAHCSMQSMQCTLPLVHIVYVCNVLRCLVWTCCFAFSYRSLGATRFSTAQVWFYPLRCLVHCSARYCAVVRSGAQTCTAVCSSALQCSGATVHSSASAASWCGAPQCCAVQDGCTVQCTTVQPSAALRSTPTQCCVVWLNLPGVGGCGTFTVWWRRGLMVSSPLTQSMQALSALTSIHSSRGCIVLPVV